MRFLPEKEREKLIEAIQKMASILEGVDLSVVSKKLASCNFVEFKDIKNGVFKIGAKPPYSYTRIAF